MEDSLILQVKEDLCIGCGLCMRVCRQRAISIQNGQARIDQARCNRCGNCIETCPRRAIAGQATLLYDGLKTSISVLRERTDNILVRIEKLQRRQ